MKTKSILIVLTVLFSLGTVQAQKGYTFTDQKVIPSTPAKNQASSGTCWSFSGTGFLESEILRLGKPEVDLSEMFIVYYAYLQKAEKYVRMHGSINFAAGGATHDVINVVKEYGIVPEEVYRGLNYGTDQHRHGELDAVLKSYVEAVVKNKTLTPVWKDGFKAILDTYLGEIPETFTYQGKEYTPKSFAESLGLNMDDYISFSSFTHHPFYTQFAVEVPDNWAWGLSYNVPLDEFAQLFSYAIDKGYPVYWASDVSEKGFRYNDGFAVVPDARVEDMTDSEKARWTELTAAEKEKQLYSFDKPVKEKEITQEARQKAFDNYETTDDHGMLIMGVATDQDGHKFYKVKNSWGESQLYKGHFYASEPFVLYKTTNLVINKNAVPKDIAKKLGIK